MDEYYIYLGKKFGIHFFIHLIKNKNFEQTVSDQIYNEMIHESRIVDPHENVIIYEVDPISESIYLTVIQHTKKDEQATFDKIIIMKMLKILFEAKRDNTFVIRHNYQKNCLESIEIKKDVMGLRMDTLVFAEDNTPISEVRYVLTTKPI